MSSDKNMKIAVVGAGLTGLTTAYYLKKAGVDVSVFEKANRVGGVIQTNNEIGFIFESGPNTGILTHPEAAELLELLEEDCVLEMADKVAKGRWIWKSAKWEPLPSSLIKGITTPLFTFPDKLRLLGEPFRKKGKNPNETLKELVLRRMGQSFLDYAVDPFVLGIYSGDPAKLIPKYALPKLYQLEQTYGSFIVGSIKKANQPKTEEDKKVTREIFSIEGGLCNLIGALEKNIGKENIHLNSHALCFEKIGENQYKSNRSDAVFTHIVSTVGAYELEKLFPFANTDKIKQVSKLEYAKVIQISLGFKKWEGIPLKAFGGLVPSRENRGVLGVLFLSSFLKNRAPENGALLSVFVGGIRKPEMADFNDHQITEIVKNEITQMMGLSHFEPDLIKIFRYKHAIPQYGIESEQKLISISELENENKGLILAGNIRDGIGMSDRIRQGKIIASKLLNI
jgi:oxygen-dependent protoporphyrinogen oxidase